MGTIGEGSEQNNIFTGKVRSAIAQYSQLVFGNARFVSVGSDEAKALVQHIFLHILQWTKQQSVDYVTPQLAEALRLPAVIGNIDFPENVIKKDWKQVVAYCLGIPYGRSAKELLEQFRAIKDAPRGTQGPRDIFSGPDGYARQKEVFRLWLSDIVPSYGALHTMDRAKALYVLFSDANRITKLLKDNGMFYPLRKWANSPLDGLHQFIDDQDRSDALYATYKFKTAFLNIAKKRAAEEKAKAKV